MKIRCKTMNNVLLRIISILLLSSISTALLFACANSEAGNYNTAVSETTIPDEIDENVDQTDTEAKEDITIEPISVDVSLDIEELDTDVDIREIDELKVENGLETLTLKKPNEVYFELYREARTKAKQAKKAAIIAYLEAKNIKKTYMLDELNESDSDFDAEIEDVSESELEGL